MEFNLRTVMAQCAETNQKYMKLRAGEIAFPKMVDLYRRLADDSVSLARAYAEGAGHTTLRNPQVHRSAVDAFWWGVHSWAVLFMADVLKISPFACALGTTSFGQVNHEIQEKFTRAHLLFAQWLRDLRSMPYYDPPDLWGMTNGSLILHHDYFWTRQVIKLTAHWGLLQNLREVPSLLETRQLLKALRRWPEDPVALAYLESDLEFFNELFSHFQFSPDVQRVLDNFLQRTHEEVDEWRKCW